MPNLNTILVGLWCLATGFILGDFQSLIEQEVKPTVKRVLAYSSWLLITLYGFSIT